MTGSSSSYPSFPLPKDFHIRLLPIINIVIVHLRQLNIRQYQKQSMRSIHYTVKHKLFRTFKTDIVFEFIHVWVRSLVVKTNATVLKIPRSVWSSYTHLSSLVPRLEFTLEWVLWRSELVKDKSLSLSPFVQKHVRT